MEVLEGVRILVSFLDLSASGGVCDATGGVSDLDDARWFARRSRSA